MRPQRKIMMVETTHAFVKLKQIKAAVSAGGIKFCSRVTLDMRYTKAELLLGTISFITSGILLTRH